MAFEYIDAETGDILDILPAKDSRYVTQHFLSRYSLKQRSEVKTITIDMNASYMSFIPTLFPNAHIIIDRFHIIQLINRSMNKTRVTIMNQLNNSNGEDQKKYRRLKRYWKSYLRKKKISLIRPIPSTACSVNELKQPSYRKYLLMIPR